MQLGMATRRKPASVRPSTTPPRSAEGTNEQSPLILLVDDIEDAREMYTEGLEYAGLRVAQAADGDHALLKMLAISPDIVVMDLAMPLVDGWEATARIKAHPKTKHIPVIALTGHATEAALTRAVEAGADAVLTKPCTPAALLAIVQQLLNRE